MRKSEKQRREKRHKDNLLLSALLVVVVFSCVPNGLLPASLEEEEDVFFCLAFSAAFAFV